MFSCLNPVGLIDFECCWYWHKRVPEGYVTHISGFLTPPGMPTFNRVIHIVPPAFGNSLLMVTRGGYLEDFENSRDCTISFMKNWQTLLSILTEAYFFNKCFFLLRKKEWKSHTWTNLKNWYNLINLSRNQIAGATVPLNMSSCWPGPPLGLQSERGKWPKTLYHPSYRGKETSNACATCTFGLEKEEFFFNSMTKFTKL